jgi:hypothetical protein
VAANYCSSNEYSSFVMSRRKVSGIKLEECIFGGTLYVEIWLVVVILSLFSNSFSVCSRPFFVAQTSIFYMWLTSYVLSLKKLQSTSMIVCTHFIVKRVRYLFCCTSNTFQPLLENIFISFLIYINILFVK